MRINKDGGRWVTPSAVLLSALLIACPFDAGAGPRSDEFQNWTSDISIFADGTLQVREVFLVYFSHSRGGLRHTIPYKFKFASLSVTLDGASEKYLLSDPERPGWIRIGMKPKRVPPGFHVYGLSYRTGPEVTFNGPIGHFLWSTGEHPIPFERVVVRFHLPVCALLRNIHFDTNMERIAQRNATAEHNLANVVTIRTTKPISPKAALHASLDFENRTRCAQG